MIYYKAMTTPMASNLKILSDALVDLVDAMMYRHMIGSLMYLMNTRLDICFAVNTLSHFLTDSRHVHLIAEVPKGYSSLWAQVWGESKD